MPAPSKFTPESRLAVIARLEAGSSLAQSCSAAGLRLATVKGWLTRGRQERQGAYSEFAAAVDAARKAAEGPMSPEEFQRHLDRSVRAGNVAAMKLWAERERRSADDSPAPKSKVDELAERRRERAS